MALDNGTSGNDTLTGTPFDDQLFGLGGSDILDGGLGNDVLDGGDGHDQLKGQAGNDTLHGGKGNDSLFGGSGNDCLIGDRGNDRLFGGADHDRLFGGTGDDILDGGTGNDSLVGGNGNDRLLGGDGNDRLFGGTGADTVEGGVGDDRIVAREFPASVNGGTGVDTLNLDELSALIDLFGPASATLTNLEKLSLDGGNTNTLVLDAQAVLNMAGAGGALPDDTLLVIGDADDAINLQGDWAKDGSVSNPFGERGSFDVYTSGAATLLVESELAVASGAAAALDLATLDGTSGFTLIGIDDLDSSGLSVSSAGDVNGDGFDDVVVGAPGARADGTGGVGESYVVFGKASWAGTPSLDLASLDGTSGIRLFGTFAYGQSGFSASTAGDVNGDGFADLIVGARNAGVGFEGESYVVLGKASWAETPSLDLATLDGTNGFRLVGIDPGDYSGFSVSSAGDVNGDGFDDMIVGARFAESAGGAEEEGESYVVFGKASWAETPSLDLATLDGTNGFSLIGIDQFDRSGRSVSSAGDVNGDGFDDMIVGAVYVRDASGGGFEGESYVVFGKANWAATPSLDLATLDGANGFSVRATGSSLFGYSVSSGGDVNGDGFADLIVGARSGKGESYVVFGKASWAGTPSLDLATLDGTNGFRLPGIDAFDNSGVSVSSAGDVNGDGFADLIVGAPGAESAGGVDQEGESYVVYGKASWAGTPSLDLAALDGTNGFRLIGVDQRDYSGKSVSSAGDVNGDGFADLIVGAPYAESAGGEREGESYVIFGGNFTGAVTHLGTTGADTLTGSAAAETFVGGTGNDLLIGKRGADAFQGGGGDDVVRVSTLDFHVTDGGSGSDTLELDGAGLDLDLIALADSRTRSIERIDIGGTGSNTLTLSVLDVLNLSDESNELLVLGDAGDVVNRGAGWTTAASGGSNGDGTSTIDGQTYQVYTAGQATLLIDTDITANTS
jgi:Ca2+-binding RTX toxin-like protein